MKSVYLHGRHYYKRTLFRQHKDFISLGKFPSGSYLISVNFYSWFVLTRRSSVYSTYTATFAVSIAHVLQSTLANIVTTPP